MYLLKRINANINAISNSKLESLYSNLLNFSNLKYLFLSDIHQVLGK